MLQFVVRQTSNTAPASITESDFTMETSAVHLPLLPDSRDTSSRVPLPPYPRGWFFIEKSANVSVGEVRAIRYFGRDLVLFRAADGTPCLLDAYCPHLGAHLGYGGCVEANTIRCPFHGWKFDTSGQCVTIPYASKIPSTAKVRAWLIREKSGGIFAFYDPNVMAPPAGWEPPDVPELEDSEWVTAHWCDRKVRSHVQEIAENLADPAHIQVLHELETGTMTAETDGHLLQLRTPVKSDGARIGMPGFELPFAFRSRAHGLGLQTVRLEETMFESLVFTTATPIDGQYVHLRTAIMTRKLPSEQATDMIHQMLVAEAIANMEKEITIWEHKIYQARPILCDIEGPLPIFRRWAKQFYEQALAPSAEE